MQENKKNKLTQRPTAASDSRRASTGELPTRRVPCTGEELHLPTTSRCNPVPLCLGTRRLDKPNIVNIVFKRNLTVTKSVQYGHMLPSLHTFRPSLTLSSVPCSSYPAALPAPRAAILDASLAQARGRSIKSAPMSVTLSLKVSLEHSALVLLVFANC